MKSVKGMTWGNPEFVALAKKAEAEAEVDFAVEQALDTIEMAEMPADCFDKARERVSIIFEL